MPCASFLVDDAIIQHIGKCVSTFDVSGEKLKVKCNKSCQSTSEFVKILIIGPQNIHVLFLRCLIHNLPD